MTVKMLYIHPDTVMLLISLAIGTIFYVATKTSIKEQQGTIVIIDGIAIFMVPIFVLSDTVTLPERPILGKSKINFIFGFLTSCLSIGATYYGLTYAIKNEIIDLGDIPDGYLVSISFLMNLSSDMGYKICAFMTSDYNLSKLVQEKYIITLFLVSIAIYTLGPGSISECSSVLECSTDII